MEEARLTREVYENVYTQIAGLMTHLVHVDPRVAPVYQTLQDIQLLRRLRRVVWHRTKKLVRLTHARGNSVPRALFWMWVCRGVVFVGEMSLERRQHLDYIKATAV